MSSKKRNLSGSFNAGSSRSVSGSRPSSAKDGRPTSASGRASARSTSSVESDFLSITGARKIPQKSGKHKRTQSGSGRLSYLHGEGSGTESDHTSSSSGARKKTLNVDQQGNLRFPENHVTPVILSQNKLKTKSKLATNFQVHQGSRASSSYQLPSKPQVAGPDGATASHNSGWWPSANDNPSVPALELKSPDNKPEHRWWPASSGDPSPASDYFSEPKNEDNWWDKLKEDDLDDDNVLATWETTKPRDSVHASVKADVPKLSLDGLLDESQKCLDFKRQRAAVTIQRWVRGWIVRRRANHSALKSLLAQKKHEREKQMQWGQENILTEEQLREKKEKERMKKREEQARLARQAAIQELQHQRENKRQENQRKAQEELQFLQASGKVTKKKANTVVKGKPRRPSGSGGSLGSPATAEPNSRAKNSDEANNSKETPRPGTSSSVGRKVDEMFQESRSAKNAYNNAPSTEENPVPLASDRTDKTITRSDLGGSKTTFDDLLESLKQLEEEPKELLDQRKPSPVVASWMDELEDTKSEAAKPYLSIESLGKLDAGKPDSPQGAQGSSLSAEKLRNILTFLDEVEKAEEDARSEITQVRENAASRGLPSPSASTSVAVDREKEMALLESASAAASDVTQAMMAVKIELEEKKRTGELLQRALNQQREFTVRQAKEMEKDAKVRIEIQRQEYEAAIQRHLSFIDQLIDDKKVLSDRCEELVKKLKEIDKKYSDKIKQMDESHGLEIKKQKEIIMAAEKLRREKWISEKTQQIKEVTVKGLEPDIQKLIAKHKAEMKRLKSVHQAELLESDERAGRRYIQQIEDLRDQLEREKEAACTRERELAQQRYEKQLEQEEQAYQQQRRRLYAEVQDEKERLALQAHKQRQELDDARAALEGSHKQSALEQQASFQRNVEDTDRRHQLEMNELKERLDIEKQSWIENYMKKQEAVLLTKERELKEGVREARDREIEMVIARLEDETALTREECERAAENRIKRVRDKYESELKELEASEQNMKQKYNTMKERLTEVEGECSRFRSLLKQKEQESDDIDRVVNRLQEERGKVADIIRQEFADRLVTTDEDNKRLKTEMSEMKARHRLETERLTQEKQHEMDELHKRVKQAIAKKEETTKMLREQQQAAMKRADHLEMLLQQQREKLLK